MKSKIKANIAEFVNKDVSTIADSTELRSLVHDSFVLVELVMGLQEDFGIRIMQEDLSAVHTVGQLIDVIEIKSQA